MNDLNMLIKENDPDEPDLVSLMSVLRYLSSFEFLSNDLEQHVLFKKFYGLSGTALLMSCCPLGEVNFSDSLSLLSEQIWANLIKELGWIIWFYGFGIMQ